MIKINYLISLNFEKPLHNYLFENSLILLFVYKTKTIFKKINENFIVIFVAFR